MSTALATTTKATKLEQVFIEGDLKSLSPGERVQYYNAVCDSLRLNPLTKPFDFIVLNGKLTLYARKDCTEQLRKRDGVSITKIEKEVIDGVFVVTAYAKNAEGREDTSTGAVPIANLKGDNLANAFMKAETKAKRRVTLSICGLGLLDETEVETVPGAKAPKEKVAQAEIIVDAEHVRELDDLITAVGADRAALLAHYRVESLDQLTIAQWENARRILSVRNQQK